MTRGPQRRNTGRLEDVEFLLSTGASPAEVVQRVGVAARALERWLQRYGRHDLARPFGRVA